MSRFEEFMSHLGLAAYELRRGHAERRPFVPFGLLPAIGLALTWLFTLIFFSMQTVQHTAKASAEEALASIGANWASVSASGQWITLEGDAPNGEMARAASEAVKTARDRTPFGLQARPITRIKNMITVRQGSVAATGDGTGDDDLRHDWEYTLDRGVLTLSGQIPNEATRKRLTTAAELRLSPPEFTSIEDNLQTTGRVANTGFTETAVRGINTLTRCAVGVASFENDKFALSCEAPAGAIDEISMLANSPLSFGDQARIDIYSPQQAEACDRSLLTLLNSTRIEFASASAVIDPASARVLGNVAQAAGSCPGQLVIEGHTDNSGLSAGNEELSLARAEAVRNALIARGVPADRLIAEGFGARRPLESNDTEDGRARNRRIEIKVIRAGDIADND